MADLHWIEAKEIHDWYVFGSERPAVLFMKDGAMAMWRLLRSGVRFRTVAQTNPND